MRWCVLYKIYPVTVLFQVGFLSMFLYILVTDKIGEDIEVTDRHPDLVLKVNHL